MKYVLIGCVTALTVVSCASEVECEGVQRHRVLWEDEPVISAYTEEYADMVQSAISQWGWGIYGGVGCGEGTGICVGDGGDYSEGWAGTATSIPVVQECHVRIYVKDQRVVTHEIGHCFGLAHSSDKDSLMYWSPTVDAEITAEDYENLDCLIEHLPNYTGDSRRDSFEPDAGYLLDAGVVPAP